MSPTDELYAPLVTAYDHFNACLFDNALPPVIFTLQRKKNVMGFFAAKRWGNAQGKLCSEISINPAYFASSRMIEIFQTLVHEMMRLHYQQEEVLFLLETHLLDSFSGEYLLLS